MAGQGGLHRDGRRFVISHLTDEDDVRVLTQERAQGGIKRQPDVRSHVDLGEPLEAVFHRILGGHQVDVFLVQLVEDRVERGRLTGTRRPGDEDHPVRVHDRFAHLLEGAALESQVVDTATQLTGTENTHDDLLAINVRERVHTEVHVRRHRRD